MYLINLLLQLPPSMTTTEQTSVLICCRFNKYPENSREEGWKYEPHVTAIIL